MSLVWWLKSANSSSVTCCVTLRPKKSSYVEELRFSVVSTQVNWPRPIEPSANPPSVVVSRLRPVTSGAMRNA
ncbi:hypothetical protein I6J71_01855 [Amycolatopsis sp. FDAARGOS 1241]|nr:hypothetical protein I6J71_01855 [Amycolatopsis sp. FDAARGOS 1241]